MSIKFCALIIAIIFGALFLTACGTAASSTSGGADVANAGPDADGDGLPDSPEALLGTDPNNADTDSDGQNDKVDPNPTLADNPITETGTKVGFTINSILVENNIDTHGAGVPDHLELALANPGATDLANFEVYYTITDPTTQVKQGYYRTLPGFILKAGETKSLHFDNTG